MSKASRLLKHINETKAEDELKKAQITGRFYSVIGDVEKKLPNCNVEEIGNNKNAFLVHDNESGKTFALVSQKKSGSNDIEWHLIRNYKGGDSPDGEVYAYDKNTWHQFNDPNLTDSAKQQVAYIKQFLTKNVDKNGKPQVKSDNASYQSDIKNLTSAIDSIPNKRDGKKEDLIAALTGKKLNEADSNTSSGEQGGQEDKPNYRFGKWYIAKDFKDQDLLVVTKDKERVYILGKGENTDKKWQIASPANNGDMDDYQLYDWDNNTMVKADKEIKQKYKNITNVVRNMRFKKDFTKDTNPENKLDKAGKNIGGYAGMLLGGPLGAYVGKKAGEWAANKIRKAI